MPCGATLPILVSGDATTMRSRIYKYDALPTMALAVCLSGQVALAGSVLFVDDDAAAGGDGAGWPTAYRFLQDALDAAADPGITEIRVAQGTYLPDRNDADPNGTGDHTATFQLINGVTILGGFAGLGAPDPDARDVDGFPTVLSGDLAGDDGPEFTNREDNSRGDRPVDRPPLQRHDPDPTRGPRAFRAGSAAVP